jgi:hypothetical protein
MTYLIPMLFVLLFAVVVLMIGILLNREPGQTIHEAISDSLVWGTGCFVSFGAEFLILGHV